MGRSWWRGLTERGPLEKGMASHFSILALRTPRTVWKGKMIAFLINLKTWVQFSPKPLVLPCSKGVNWPLNPHPSYNYPVQLQTELEISPNAYQFCKETKNSLHFLGVPLPEVCGFAPVRRTRTPCLFLVSQWMKTLFRRCGEKVMLPTGLPEVGIMFILRGAQWSPTCHANHPQTTSGFKTKMCSNNDELSL